MDTGEMQNLSRVEKRKALTKQHTIDSALQLFAENGYANTTVDEITNLADIGHGTFYKYFNNKQHLLTVLAEDLIQIVDDYFHPKNRKLSVLDRLTAEAKGILEFYDRHRNILLALKEAMAVDKHFEEQWTKIHESLFKRVESDIKGSNKKGFCRDINADVVIIALSCMLEGYGHHVMMQPPGSIDIEAAAASLADLAYHGVFIT